MYRWESSALRRDSFGHIFVMASSIEEARRLALEEFPRYYKLWYNDDPSKKLIELFKKDLEDLPEMVRVALLFGGE